MDTFYLIINKILKIENNIFFTYYDGIGVDPLLKVLFKFGFEKMNNENIPIYKKKFVFLKEAMNNFIIKGHREEEVFDYFNKIQRTYHSLNRFAFIYKFKKAKLIVNTDMGLNEISEFDKNVICIYQENAKYLFKIYDLLKIINMSLIHSHNFFADPVCIKNPYNNLPFGKNILYYIHYFLTEKNTIGINIKYSELFFKFYECQFNLTDFLNKYEYLLREKTITNIIKNLINDDAYKNIMSMINEFNMNKNEKNKIFIDEKFPKDKLVKIFNPYLNIYWNSKYLLVSTLKYKSLYELKAKLIKFQKFNPLFGRMKILYKKKICRDGKIRTFKINDVVNDSHINFNEYENDEFFKDHLSYKYINIYNDGALIYEDNESNEYDEDDNESNEYDEDDNESNEYDEVD
jgi:hypothetical protein